MNMLIDSDTLIDPIIFEVQREQLAQTDLRLLCSQAVALMDAQDPEAARLTSLAFQLTFDRIKRNLVAGSKALLELETLKGT